MDLQSYLRVLRKRWRTVAVTTLVFVALAALMTLLTPKTYQSKVEFFVSTSDASGNAQLAQGSTFTQARVKSYTQLLTAPKVLGPVAKKVGGGATAKSLATKVASSVPPDTVLIDVLVTDSKPERAQQIAAQIGSQFPGTVQDLERVSASQPSPVKVTVVQDPTVNTAPVNPKPTRNIALGLVLGLLLGLGLAVLRERFDNRVRSQEDVETVTDLSVLGGIPFDSDAPNHPLIVQADPHSSRSEAFRSLRTNLQFVNAAKHPRVIVMTSSLAGEGKTTTTANLALTLAESGAKVVLIEGDLRRPRLLRYLGMEGAVGLTDVLIERAELKDVVQRFGEHDLGVIGAGQIPPNPSELLGSEALRAVLEELKTHFDYVIIDAPPLLPVTDAAILGAICDGTVLVAASGEITGDQLETALDSLERVNATTLGIVLNKVPRKRGGRYYDYRYQYAPEDLSTSRKDRRLIGRKADA
ncbi:tyrosine-protein kinase domain-containing protein [Calidifontibacter terrae]